MKEVIFHLIFSIAFIAMFALRTYYGRKARRNRANVNTFESKMNMAIRAILGLGYIGSLFVYIFVPRIFEWGIIPLPDGFRWIGVLITCGSLVILWWVQWALDIQFDTTLHTQSDHKLITHGPYHWVRHPMYTTLFLMGLGWFLLTTNWFVGVPLMVGIVLVILSRVNSEESMLLDIFGDEYLEYMQHTGRFFPSFSLTADIFLGKKS